MLYVTQHIHTHTHTLTHTHSQSHTHTHTHTHSENKESILIYIERTDNTQIQVLLKMLILTADLKKLYVLGLSVKNKNILI